MYKEVFLLIVNEEEERWDIYNNYKAGIPILTTPNQVNGPPRKSTLL